ncbi:MAG TPA: hypothetical protein VJH67_00790 [Candidatus Paceibacterota bacterium]
MTVGQFLAKINEFILNPVIILGFVVATAVFFFGVAKFIASSDDDTKREEGKKSIVYGIVGMFIMFSVYGIVNFVLNTFGIPNQTGGIIPR